MSSWVPIPLDSDFSLQNLPYGVFHTTADPVARIGVAIGNCVLDLKALAQEQAFDDLGFDTTTLKETTLNSYAALGQRVQSKVRKRLHDLLAEDGPLNDVLRDHQERRERCLLSMDSVTMHLPVTVGDFTDFFVGLHHANNVSDNLGSPIDARRLILCKVCRFSEVRGRHHTDTA